MVFGYVGALRRRCGLPAIGALLAAFCLPAAPANAQPAAGPLKFIPESPDASVRINARFARKPNVCEARQPRDLHSAYKGVLEVGRRADGSLYLVSELTFPEYLAGVAEVPRNWPLEALKAQVVAARTYAVSRLNPKTDLARELNFNICATDACQVYRGLSVERGAWGDQWARAVAETRGEILQYNGHPAETFYFSTSNGKTYSNKQVFGGAPLPYLKSVQETDDEASPLANWSARMPLSDLTETLRLAGVWAAGQIEDVDQNGDNIEVSGAGSRKTMSVEQFRARLNSQAVCLVPKRYPTASPGGGSLPQVVPSKWMQVRREGSDVVMTGRGWGHGVGMVQWGVKGKAEKGQTYRQMLAFYYGGLEPVAVSEPGKIRVGLATDIEEITIERRGPVKVVGAAVPDGPVRVSGGAGLAVSAGVPIDPVLRLEKVAGSSPANPNVAAAAGAGPPLGGGPGTPVKFSFELSGPANVRIKLRGPDGSEKVLPPEPRERGPGSVLLDAGIAGLPSGTFDVVVEADDGVDIVASGPFQVIVVGGVAPVPGLVVPRPPGPAATQSPGAPKGGRGAPEPAGEPLGVAAFVLLAAVAAGWVSLSLVRFKRT